ncbi:glycosyltransferase family 2 protein [Nibricoccus sp. IMCC34717]|uniref:glycosyltransferase family 2 protein n=1 Tax=Nibricoccus sp. IMCC34717 TaxID=3034021 RepID=UPI00384D3A18
MSNQPSISICFPAFNEGKTVYNVVADACTIVEKLCKDFEVLVCNDGSTDETLQELERLQRDYPKVRILNNIGNRGLAFTFTRLYNEACKDFVFLNATDGQWPNRILQEMVPLTSSADIVVSVRIDKHYPIIRRVISGIYNTMPRVLFGVDPKDAGGVKLIARRYLYQGEIISKSPFADAERIIRAVRSGARVAYIPVATRPRSTGKSNAIKVLVLARCFIDLFRVYIRLVVFGRWRLCPSFGKDCTL